MLQKGKVISFWMDQARIDKLDNIIGDLSRSKAMVRILDYILSQPDAWVRDFVNRPSAAEAQPTHE